VADAGDLVTAGSLLPSAFDIALGVVIGTRVGAGTTIYQDWQLEANTALRLEIEVGDDHAR
jgi:hypothetical protein